MHLPKNVDSNYDFPKSIINFKRNSKNNARGFCELLLKKKKNI